MIRRLMSVSFVSLRIKTNNMTKEDILELELLNLVKNDDYI